MLSFWVCVCVYFLCDFPHYSQEIKAWTILFFKGKCIDFFYHIPIHFTPYLSFYSTP